MKDEPSPRWVCREIAKDMEADMNEFEGKPFIGSNVATMFGRQAAAIAALALLIEKLLPYPEHEGDWQDKERKRQHDAMMEKP